MFKYWILQDVESRDSKWRYVFLAGYISMEEFSDACALLGEHLPNVPPEQLVDICRSMDINKDGHVDLNEFLETFRLVDMDHEDRPDGEDSSPDEETHRLE